MTPYLHDAHRAGFEVSPGARPVGRFETPGGKCWTTTTSCSAVGKLETQVGTHKSIVTLNDIGASQRSARDAIAGRANTCFGFLAEVNEGDLGVFKPRGYAFSLWFWGQRWSGSLLGTRKNLREHPGNVPHMPDACQLFVRSPQYGDVARPRSCRSQPDRRSVVAARSPTSSTGSGSVAVPI
jgi:hypothetical protein